MEAVRLDVDHGLAWWRPFVQWLFALPHLAYLGALSVVSAVSGIVMAVAVVTTGRVPPRLASLQVVMLRQRARTYSYFWLLRGSYPPLARLLTADDPADDPFVTVTLIPPRSVSRWSPLVRPLLVFPHVVVLVPVGIAMDLLYPVLAIVAAVSRGWPPAIARFLVAVEVWVVAVIGYALLASEERPVFGFAAHQTTPSAAAPAIG